MVNVVFPSVVWPHNLVNDCFKKRKTFITQTKVMIFYCPRVIVMDIQ